MFQITFSRTKFFTSIQVRTNLSDFAVLIAILICVGVDVAFGLETPKLFVPSEFKTTIDGRGWLVNPTLLKPWYLILLAIIPAILATILIFLDQQITAVIVNRKDHKLKVRFQWDFENFRLLVYKHISQLWESFGWKFYMLPEIIYSFCLYFMPHSWPACGNLSSWLLILNNRDNGHKRNIVIILFVPISIVSCQQKSPGYHLDLFVIAILIGLCSALGLPWFVAATVRSITHVKSLIKWSECSAPGDRPEMLGVR